ncbi:MAG: AtpZ/AtpI family protein [Deltaproteobacteria bacterium]|nr:AtpZ/AtpI family protein [Deltaproteobacteria bacterium]
MKGFAAVSEVIVYVVAGFAAGYYLDHWINTNPVFSVLFTLAGFCVGFYRLYKVMRQDEDSSKGNKST